MIRSALTRVPAPVLVVAAILSLQFGAGIARTHFETVGPLGATFLRLFFGAVILLLVLRPRVRHWNRRAWGAAVILGVALAGMNSMIYLAIQTVPLGVAVTIEFMGPLVLALVQTRRIVDAFWALLAFAGVLILGLDLDGGIAITGLLFAVGAGTCWALYIVATERVGREIPGIDGLAVALTVACVLVAPFGIGGASGAIGDPTVLLVFVAVAILSSALPYALELMSLRRISTRVFGVLSSLGPAAAGLAGFVVVGQALGVREIVALLLVTIASAGITLARPKAERSATATSPAAGPVVGPAAGPVVGISAGDEPILDVDRVVDKPE